MKMLFVLLLCLVLPTVSVAEDPEYNGDYRRYPDCECGNPLEVGYSPYSGYRCSKDCSNNYYYGKKGTVKRFYFDSYDGYCKSFYYYGCGGNSNNFKTLYECQNRCEQRGSGYEESGGSYCYVCPYYSDPRKRRSAKAYYCKGGGCHGDDCYCKPGYKCCKVNCYYGDPVRRRRDSGSYYYGYECVKAEKKYCGGGGSPGGRIAVSGVDALPAPLENVDSDATAASTDP